MPAAETTIAEEAQVAAWASRINLCKMYDLRYVSSEWFDHLFDIVMNARFRDWDTFLGTTLDKLQEYANMRSNDVLEELERRKHLLRRNPAIELHVIACKYGLKCSNKACTYMHV